MKGWRFWAIWIPLVVLALVGLFSHEMWLDEMHHWLLARDSDALPELAYNARFESHPLLWNGLLWVITRFTHDPVYMQVLHGLIVMGVVTLWVRYAPFPWYVLVLGGLGYFFLYEYAALSRNYALGVLGLFIGALQWRNEKNRITLITIGCLLAAYSHLLFLIPGVVLFAVFMYKQWPQIEFSIRTLYVVMFAVVLLPAVYWCIPHSGHTYLQLDESGLFSWSRIESSLHYLTIAFIPIQDMTVDFWWNANWLQNRVDHSLLFALIGLLSFILLAFTLRKNRNSLFFFILSLLGILTFAWLSEMKAVRYTGPIWVSYLVAWWIGGKSFRLDFSGWTLIILVTIHAIGGVLAWQMELRKPFSQGKAAASYINTEGLEALPIYSFPECAALVTVGYLGQSACYPQTSICGSYCHWPEIPGEQQVQVFWENLNEELKSKNKPVLLLLNRPLPTAYERKVEPLRFFTNAQVYFGDVYLYRY